MLGGDRLDLLEEGGVIAAAIAWLLDPACLMTGQLMVVDGGFSLGKPPAAAGAQ